jgi:hypothetical protein
MWSTKKEYCKRGCEDGPTVLDLLRPAGVGECQCTFDNNSSKTVANEYQWSFESIAEVAISMKVGDELQRL